MHSGRGPVEIGAARGNQSASGADGDPRIRHRPGKSQSFTHISGESGMATEIKLPQLGENLAGGDVLDVKVATGDTVSPGQTLLEVEAEKSTVEVPSPLAGRVQQMLVKKGDAITVGQVLAVVEETGPGLAEAAKTPQAKSTKGERGVEAPLRVKEEQSPAADGQD